MWILDYFTPAITSIYYTHKRIFHNYNNFSDFIILIIYKCLKQFNSYMSLFLFLRNIFKFFTSSKF